VVETLKNELASSSHPFPSSLFSPYFEYAYSVLSGSSVSLTFALQIDLTTSKW
jgi:hypothetical protein